MRNQRAKEKREMQFASVAQAWRVIQSGRMTLEEIKECPPDKISKERWAAMLNHRKEAEKNA